MNHIMLHDGDGWLLCEQGFDGVFLDVIDSYEYFESKNN